MKKSLKNLITVGTVILTLYTPYLAIAAQTSATTSKQTSIEEEHRIINEYYQLEEQKKGLEKRLTEIKKEIKKKKIPIEYFREYGTELTLEDYSRIVQIAKEHNLRENSYVKFIKLEKVLEYEPFIDKITKYYGIDKKEMFMLWNQESSFSISGLGPHGERGLAQFRSLMAKLIFDRLSNQKDILYFDWKTFYPQYNTKKYDFEQLSEDYKLNIIMTAAQIKLTPHVLGAHLKKANIGKEQFFRLLRNKGMKARFDKLKAAQKNPANFNLSKDLEKTIKDYQISDARIKLVHRIFREDEMLLRTALEYIVHNGGGGAVSNIITDSVIGEILIYHLALYVNNLKELYKFMNYHYGNLENLVKAHKHTVEQLTVEEKIDLWGHELTKVDLKELKKYVSHGLTQIELDPGFFQKEELIIVDNYMINEYFTLSPLDKSISQMSSSVKEIDIEYEKLIMFKQLEKEQSDLNEAWAKKDQEGIRKHGVAVTTLEKEINKRFKLQRGHTGIRGVMADIEELEKEIRDAGFIPDLEKYNSMKNPTTGSL